MPHKKYFHRPTVIKDVAILITVNFILMLAYAQIDLLELAYHLSRDYEAWQLDELLPLGISISISLLIFSYRRIKELGTMAQTLEKMSFHDLLSGLANRRAGQISLLSWCKLAEEKNQTFIVYQVNLDEFSKVNELYGQLVGDEVIKHVAERLNIEKTKSGQLFRWLDDNFIIIIPLNEVNTPNEFAYKLQHSINNKVMASTLSLSCSIGYAVWKKGQTVDDILFEAEDALVNAKHSDSSSVKGSL